MKSCRVHGLCLMLVAMLGGCTNWWHLMSGEDGHLSVSSSLVAYLYPDGSPPSASGTADYPLNPPLHVGVAFVPASSAETAAVLSAVERQRLLENAGARFSGRPEVRRLTIIPDAYLKAGKGFATLDQITRMYDLDVLALVSYDQVSIVDDRTSSLLYWSVVGAYFVHGSQNDVQTFVDTAVFNARSHELLFRAAGVNTLGVSSTLIGSPEALRKARSDSFALAMEDMTRNLTVELEKFQQRPQAGKAAR